MQIRAPRILNTATQPSAIQGLAPRRGSLVGRHFSNLGRLRPNAKGRGMRRSGLLHCIEARRLGHSLKNARAIGSSSLKRRISRHLRGASKRGRSSSTKRRASGALPQAVKRSVSCAFSNAKRRVPRSIRTNAAPLASPNDAFAKRHAPEGPRLPGVQPEFYCYHNFTTIADLFAFLPRFRAQRFIFERYGPPTIAFAACTQPGSARVAIGPLKLHPRPWSATAIARL